MKTLTLEDCIDLLGPVTPAQAEADELRLPTDPEGSGWLAAGVASGAYQSCAVTFNGEKIGRFYYSTTAQHGLNLVAGVSLVKRDAHELFHAAYQKLARQLGLKYIVTTTRRPGLLRKYQTHGFEIVGVTVRKNLT